jgi:hypothetical protein
MAAKASKVAAMNVLARLLALLVVALLATACATRVQASVVPLPSLPPGPIDIRVAYAVNPRLPRMDARQLELLLESMQKAVNDHFGVQLRFLPVQVVPISSLFETIPASRRLDASKNIFDFKSGTGNRRRLDLAFGRGFRQAGEPLDEMVEFARPYTGALSLPDFKTFGTRMAALQLERIELWRARKALDGGPAIDQEPFNEFLMWLALGYYGEVPFELVLTNQVIASVEYGWPAVHAAVRGGYSNGITTYNRRSRFGTMSIWSTYAFTGNDAQLVQLRNGERYTEEEAARLAGLSGAHEMGHQLLHLTHPYGRQACLMSPVPMFSYREWAAKLSASQCPLGSDPAVTPGKYKGFTY